MAAAAAIEGHFTDVRMYIVKNCRHHEPKEKEAITMKPINKVVSVLTPLDRKNVDTDQIISKEFLKRIERTGFGKYLFYHWRSVRMEPRRRFRFKRSAISKDPKF